LQRKVNGQQLAYLDNAATTQKPRQVIEAIEGFYELHNANIHRGVHALSEEATELYEGARKKVAKFINAKEEEIIFTRNATESINLVRFAWGHELKKDDKLVLTKMEHHSNLVPWQMLAKERHATLDFIGIDSNSHLAEKDTRKIEGARLFAFTQMSNVLGTITPARELVKKAHEAGALALVDGAQSVPHMEVDVKALDADFMAFSGHKMLGPTGIGILYGKKELLERMQPFMAGGDMIKEVQLKESTWNDLPWKFEAGTPNVSGAVGLGAAIDYLSKIGMKNIRAYEEELTDYALKEMQKIRDIKLYGPKSASDKGGILTFNLGEVHSHDVASLLNDKGIAIRSGHHCAMPLMESLGICNAARASFYIYTTKQEIDALVAGVENVRRVFKMEKDVRVGA